MRKTLYVSDLDGTLLRSDKTLSPYTVQTINDFIGAGGLFTFATARSHRSSRVLTAQLRLHLPIITYNGSFIRDVRTNDIHHGCLIPAESAARIIRRLTDAGVYPIVYAHIDGKERVSWVTGQESEGVRLYVTEREASDRRFRPVDDAAALTCGKVFYLTIIDTHDAVEAAWPLLDGETAIRAHILRDSYHPENDWLEISAHDASKALALERLRAMLGIDRIVCFGDNLNDLSMFECADEGYAVANAMPALKKAATEIIAANDEDGVARFLAERVMPFA